MVHLDGWRQWQRGVERHCAAIALAHDCHGWACWCRAGSVGLAVANHLQQPLGRPVNIGCVDRGRLGSGCGDACHGRHAGRHVWPDVG
ncbi:Uncharacterised protein [Chlamydia trachomatis]|nr:Uncharacterised protein [Chlamydia trachomatis]